MTRLIGISDIHGEYEKLCSVLNKIDPKKEDTIIFMGDYIDRGSKSKEVVAVSYTHLTLPTIA
mgnify:CR=1 FL=1